MIWKKTRAAAASGLTLEAKGWPQSPLKGVLKLQSPLKGCFIQKPWLRYACSLRFSPCTRVFLTSQPRDHKAI